MASDSRYADTAAAIDASGISLASCFDAATGHLKLPELGHPLYYSVGVSKLATLLTPLCDAAARDPSLPCVRSMRLVADRSARSTLPDSLFLDLLIAVSPTLETLDLSAAQRTLSPADLCPLDPVTRARLPARERRRGRYHDVTPVRPGAVCPRLARIATANADHAQLAARARPHAGVVVTPTPVKEPWSYGEEATRTLVMWAEGWRLGLRGAVDGAATDGDRWSARFSPTTSAGAGAGGAPTITTAVGGGAEGDGGGAQPAANDDDDADVRPDALLPRDVVPMLAAMLLGTRITVTETAVVPGVTWACHPRPRDFLMPFARTFHVACDDAAKYVGYSYGHEREHRANDELVLTGFRRAVGMQADSSDDDDDEGDDLFGGRPSAAASSSGQAAHLGIGGLGHFTSLSLADLPTRLLLPTLQILATATTNVSVRSIVTGTVEHTSSALVATFLSDPRNFPELSRLTIHHGHGWSYERERVLAPIRDVATAMARSRPLVTVVVER